MNSLGVSPYVNWMYSDLADGLIIFQLYDIINPGVVTWPKVHKKFNRMKKFMEKLENCNYVVELGRKQSFSLVGIAGQAGENILNKNSCQMFRYFLFKTSTFLLKFL